jgi:transcriptional regulator with XRE-family HTH domain
MADKVKEIFSANIRRYRNSYGYSQEKLAEIAGVSTSFVASIETCKKFPSSKNIAKLDDAFGLKPYQLFQEPEATAQDTSQLGELKEDLKLKVSDQIESYFRRYLKNR